MSLASEQCHLKFVIPIGYTVNFHISGFDQRLLNHVCNPTVVAIDVRPSKYLLNSKNKDVNNNSPNILLSILRVNILPNHPSGGSINDILYRKYVLISSPGQLVNIPSRIQDFVFYSNKQFSQSSLPNGI